MSLTSYSTIASESTIAKTVDALRSNGIEVHVVDTATEAYSVVLELIPAKSKVMTYTSVTLEKLGLTKELSNENKYNPVRKEIEALNKATDAKRMNELGAAPEYAVGSVHAITENGEVIIASNSGSQLPAYSYAAQNVVWVVGAQKIVKSIDEGLKRVYDYVLPLESERAKKAYGVSGSNVSKLLIINKEVKPGRIKIILIKESIGY